MICNLKVVGSTPSIGSVSGTVKLSGIFGKIPRPGSSISFAVSLILKLDRILLYTISGIRFRQALEVEQENLVNQLLKSLLKMDLLGPKQNG